MCSEVDDSDLISNYATSCVRELQPMCTFLGGIVAQEVSKWTGKFTPNQGFLHLDFMEILPDERPKDVEPLNSRYDHQIAAFGKSLQEKLGDIRTFMVGCGALGCELLKNFAMMGVACHDGNGKGLITVTDDDKIEVSNLNRQFLLSRNAKQADAATSRIVQYVVFERCVRALCSSVKRENFNHIPSNTTSITVSLTRNYTLKNYARRMSREL